MPKHPLSICILSSAHEPMDERIYYHFAKTLVDTGHHVTIICSTSFCLQNESNLIIDSFDSENIGLFGKIEKFNDRLRNCQPDVIISQEPLTNFAAFQYKYKSSKKPRIIYDITEWYPSQTHFRTTKNILSKIGKAFIFAVFNLFSCLLVNAFIFGESSKRFPYNILFPFKKSILISYFPNPVFFPNDFHVKRDKNWVFGYTGIFNIERGFFYFLNAIIEFKKRNSEVRFKLVLIGWFENADFEKLYESKIKELEGLEISFYKRLSFIDFCENINEIDICFDLRTLNWEKNNSLPIKLFYYMASAKPVIYSDIKAIKKEVPEIVEIGQLVNPKETTEIVEAIEKYVQNPALYQKHSEMARFYFLKKYNWNALAPTFIRFIEA